MSTRVTTRAITKLSRLAQCPGLGVVVLHFLQLANRNTTLRHTSCSCHNATLPTKQVTLSVALHTIAISKRTIALTTLRLASNALRLCLSDTTLPSLRFRSPLAAGYVLAHCIISTLQLCQLAYVCVVNAALCLLIARWLITYRDMFGVVVVLVLAGQKGITFKLNTL